MNTKIKRKQYFDVLIGKTSTEIKLISPPHDKEMFYDYRQPAKFLFEECAIVRW